MTWIGEFGPANHTIWVVFDEESDVFRSQDVIVECRQICLRKNLPYVFLSQKKIVLDFMYRFFMFLLVHGVIAGLSGYQAEKAETA